MHFLFEPRNIVILLVVILQLVFAAVGSADDARNDTTKPDQSNSSRPSQLHNRCNLKLNKITGTIQALQHDDISNLRMSLMNTKILINYGQYIAYPKDDGTFEVDNIPSDSYVVEVAHPKYVYEPFRVDITSKGKMRARRVNYIQPSLVQTVDYPLVFRPKSLHNYFLARETWRIQDILLNPMVLMMAVPMLIIWLLPKMSNPQEAQAQREAMQMPEYNVPELSEMMTSMFGQGSQGSTGGNQQSGSSGGGQQQAITSGRQDKKKRR